MLWPTSLEVNEALGSLKVVLPATVVPVDPPTASVAPKMYALAPGGASLFCTPGPDIAQLPEPNQYHALPGPSAEVPLSVVTVT
jgi:hypothetical protein